jgi:hypothetical protein
MNTQRPAGKSSPIYQLICFLFVISQTILMLLAFSLSFTATTLSSLATFFYTIY